jgi:hypothetical protein
MTFDHEETTMTLDDVYGSDQERFPLEQESGDWDAEDLGLVWDETELQRATSDLGVPRHSLGAG